MDRAAETLTPVSLELGGKDPMVVLEGANIERAANAAAWGGMINSGQICMSVERIYVEEPAYDEFVTRLTDSVKELRQGADGAEFGSDVGAMTSAATRSTTSKSQVDDALSARGQGRSPAASGSTVPATSTSRPCSSTSTIR